MSRLIIIFIILIGATIIGVAAHSHKGSAVASMVPPVTDLKSWQWRAVEPASGGVKPDQGGVRIDVLQVDSNNLWKLEFFHVGPRLKNHQKYRISFATKASAPFAYEVSGMSDITDWFRPSGNAHLIGFEQDVEATTEWTRKSYTFETKDTDGFPDQVPMFTVGSMPGTLWIKDVTMTEVE